ncbi:MAG: hypothetical protein QXJ74_09515 [Nitrososphaera sp.]|uniref:hypothetical protein n=1 Tax=Nitrososphaera sp. TaxID=1971748 RepID=UPI00317A70D1
MASKSQYVMIGIGFVVAAIIAIIFMAGSLTGGTQVNPLSSYIPQERRENVVNGIIGVQAGGYQAYPFFAPSGSTNVSVKGSFEASGGSGNDIRVFIVDSQSFTNWKNGHQVSTYYNSGQLTTDTLNESIPTGEQMYLVFDNSFSTFTDKQVRTTIDLIYTN